MLFYKVPFLSPFECFATLADIAPSIKILDVSELAILFLFPALQASFHFVALSETRAGPVNHLEGRPFSMILVNVLFAIIDNGRVSL
jgi:hypothetical protein